MTESEMKQRLATLEVVCLQHNEEMAALRKKLAEAEHRFQNESAYNAGLKEAIRIITQSMFSETR
jgi:light-regulated signal transduction histidine kinase (bacteriophytochrome)